MGVWWHARSLSVRMIAVKVIKHGVYMWDFAVELLLGPFLKCRGCSWVAVESTWSVHLFGCCCTLSCHCLQDESSHTHPPPLDHAIKIWGANMYTFLFLLWDLTGRVITYFDIRMAEGKWTLFRYNVCMHTCRSVSVSISRG